MLGFGSRSSRRQLAHAASKSQLPLLSARARRIIVDREVEVKSPKQMEAYFKPFTIERLRTQIAQISERPSVYREEELANLQAIERAIRYFALSEFASVRPPYGNGLIGGACHAYAEHQGIVLTPESFVCTILQAVARYIATSDLAQVKPEDRAELVVEMDNRVERPWKTRDLARLLRDQLFTRDAQAQYLIKLVCRTGTYRLYPVPCDITVLAAFKNRYVYRAMGYACGIPVYHLEGIREEWLEIGHVAQTLRAKPELVELVPWLTAVNQIVDQLAIAEEDDPDLLSFLRRMVQHKQPCCSEGKISGWLTALLPYYKGKLRSTFDLEAGEQFDLANSLAGTLQSDVPVQVDIRGSGSESDTFSITLMAGVGLRE